MANYTFFISNVTKNKFDNYLTLLKSGGRPGIYLRNELKNKHISKLSLVDFIECLIATKHPCISAESEVFGDGSDWNQTELSLLGDICVSVPVMIYDNGSHLNPKIHNSPFKGTLLYVPGALLQARPDGIAADWKEIIKCGYFDETSYYQLIERRLLTALLHANVVSAQRQRRAIVTIPGLGCGMFSGAYRGKMGTRLLTALKKMLLKNASKLSYLKLIHFDPYQECVNHQESFGQTLFRVRPLLQGNFKTNQLCLPKMYEEGPDDFSDCDLFSVVAWDHVSWPGNDYYDGLRVTDDGVKSAATNSMEVLTGFEGSYNLHTNLYQPPRSFVTWGELVTQFSLKLKVKETNVSFVDID
jgi:hypothetical protein